MPSGSMTTGSVCQMDGVDGLPMSSAIYAEGPRTWWAGAFGSGGYFSFQDFRQVLGFHRSKNPGLGLVRTRTVTRTAS
mgnify:FL=1